MTVFIAAFVGSLIGFFGTTPIRHLFLWVIHWGIIAVLAIAVRKELLIRCCVCFFSRKFIGRNPG
jgi:hypothetical protein